MKICAISDLHGQISNLDFSRFEIVCIAGDIAPTYGFGKWHIHKQAKWVQNKFCELCKNFPLTTFVVIPGNHDHFAVSNFYQGINNSINWPKNVHFLIDQQIEIFGLKIYGTPWVPPISGIWAFEADIYKQTEMFSKIPDNLDILITHSPPHISNDIPIDYSIQTCYGPFGSHILASEIARAKPKYVFCGHIHSGDHSMINVNEYFPAFGDTKLINVSRLDESYTIKYEPYILEI